MPPSVSVVMPVYNGERFLAESIASVLGQTYVDFEFIVVDDGSTDGSADILQEYADRDERIRPLLLSSNEGKGTARNRGIAAASGEYIATLDGDDICLPDRLRRQISYMRSNPDIGVLGCTLWSVGPDLRPHGKITVPNVHSLIAWGLFFGPAAGHSSTLMRRDVLLAAGAYEAGRVICDDLELWSRMVEKTHFANLPDVLLLYRRHPEADSIKKRSLQQEAGTNIRKTMLKRLWGEAPPETVDRFLRLRNRRKDFSRTERKLLRAEMERLIESFVTAGWVDEDDRPTLTVAMEQTLLRIKPRRRHFWKYLL